jgi:zinc protease
MRIYCFPALALVFLAMVFPAAATEVREVRTRGGLTAWLVQDATVPALSLRLVVRHAGAAYDPPGKEGMASLTTSLLTEGAGERDAKSFREALDFYAIRLDTEVGADDVTFSMRTLSEHQGIAFSLLRDAMLTPRFAKPDLERVRREHLAALRLNAGDGDYQAQRALASAVFGKHPYARPEGGAEASLAALTTEDLRAFTTRHFRQGEVILSVAGDITPARLKKELERTLDALPEGTSDAPPLAPVTPNLGGEEQSYPLAVPQSVVRFALPGVPRRSEEYFAAFVLNQLFGGGTLSSRLGKELREKNGLAYYASSDVSERDGAALLAGGFATRNDKVREAVARLRALATILAREGFTQEELDAGISYLTGGFPARLSSNASVVLYLEAMQRYDLGRDYLDRRNDLLRAVTLPQVNALARRLLDPERLTVAIAGGGTAQKKGR